MCLLILKPANTRLPTPEEIGRAWARNKDGGGFSFCDARGVLSLVKGIFSLSSMLASMNEHLTPETESVIHLRYSTHAGDRVKNCHPHRIGDGSMGVCSHNGVIDIDNRKGESDTRSYIRQVIEPLMRESGGTVSKAMARVIGRDIGRGNKLVITPQGGPSVIVNEESGCWRDGIWWSNTSAFAPVATPTPTPTRKGWAEYEASASGGYAHWHTGWSARQTPAPDPRPTGPDRLTCSRCGESGPIGEMRWRGSRLLCLDCGLSAWGKK
jgi:hypothetical protein